MDSLHSTLLLQLLLYGILGSIPFPFSFLCAVDVQFYSGQYGLFNTVLFPANDRMISSRLSYVAVVLKRLYSDTKVK